MRQSKERQPLKLGDIDFSRISGLLGPELVAKYKISSRKDLFESLNYSVLDKISAYLELCITHSGFVNSELMGDKKSIHNLNNLPNDLFRQILAFNSIPSHQNKEAIIFKTAVSSIDICHMKMSSKLSFDLLAAYAVFGIGAWSLVGQYRYRKLKEADDFLWKYCDSVSNVFRSSYEKASMNDWKFEKINIGNISKLRLSTLSEILRVYSFRVIELDSKPIKIEGQLRWYSKNVPVMFLDQKNNSWSLYRDNGLKSGYFQSLRDFIDL